MLSRGDQERRSVCTQTTLQKAHGSCLSFRGSGLVDHCKSTVRAAFCCCLAALTLTVPAWSRGTTVCTTIDEETACPRPVADNITKEEMHLPLIPDSREFYHTEKSFS